MATLERIRTPRDVDELETSQAIDATRGPERRVRV
jgi:hypothetical protein